MLKSLDLVGFKSFADRTRFQFDAGMTAIVGPNGSGKSNVVDAIRWILGEQSPKSLRGKEMADVIFNGTATRRGMGMAEVSLTLDNSRRFLPLESPLVTITRRVYRDSEGEYLIQGQPARLRDIKDLFLGTGAGGNAYSIIEQGKVESLLQAQAKERRAIFEEAAGISKFRARKIECLRRLDRVEQQLLRVKDVHEELDKQLRAMRSQAGKARKFREYSDRLRELRLELGLADFREQSRALSALADGQNRLVSQIEQCQERVALLTQKRQENEERLAEQEERARVHERKRAVVREELRVLCAEQQADVRRAEELAAELIELQRTAVACQLQLRAYDDLRAELERQLNSEQAGRDHWRQAIDDLQRELAELSVERDGLERKHALARKHAEAAIRGLARLENEQSGLEAQLGLLCQELERHQGRHRQLLDRQLAALRAQAEWSRLVATVEWESRRCQTDVTELAQEYKSLLTQRSQWLEAIAASRGERNAALGRREILENFRDRHEGLAGGARWVLTRRDLGEEPWKRILGALAEQLTVAPPHAELVEIALEEWSQALLVRRASDIDGALLQAAAAVPGRVTFLPIEPPSADPLVLVAEETSLVCMASLVEVPADLRGLVDRLLGATYLVDNSAAARSLASAMPAARLVTQDGEVFDASGAVRAGANRVAAGILPRAAEIRTLGEQIERAEAVIQDQTAALAACERRIDALERRLSANEVRQSTFAEQLRYLENLCQQSRRLAEQLSQEHLVGKQDEERLRLEIRTMDDRCAALDEELAAAHRSIEEASEQGNQFAERLSAAQAGWEERREQVKKLEVELVKVEERLRSLAERRAALLAEEQRREREARERHERLARTRERAQTVIAALLNRSSQEAALYARVDALEQEPGRETDLAALRAQRQSLDAEIDAARQELDHDREQLHAIAIESAELRSRREALCSRIVEDYGVQLAELTVAEAEPSLADEELRRQEIESLKEKIARLGSVNLQAIEELDAIEQRTENLRLQLDDLGTARRHLEEVIGKINEESRRLFLETFESVREHFQELFRRLFGGGRADILLEDETDVLESGIEIIGRPPGKEPTSISLLSGGEKTLTAVALLLAIFRSRPSPFCILDEVDAALDEANIGRYVGVLREFLDQTQFIIITHSKTTMAAADVLHGVTQRESGVSIRVSLRLENVTDDGDILYPDDSSDAREAS